MVLHNIIELINEDEETFESEDIERANNFEFKELTEWFERLADYRYSFEKYIVDDGVYNEKV